MKAVRIVHSRRIDAPSERVGQLLDTLGTDDDQLWPADRWGADMRVRFDRPLAVGASGGHGMIHYTVDSYTPGRHVWFRFDDPGLDGRHGFDVVDADDGGSELVHTLEGELSGSTRLAWPIIRPMHDAYVEDMMDRAEEMATGRVVPPARAPRWLRAWNGFDRRRQQSIPSARLTRVAGTAVPALLVGAGLIHAAWAWGWRWPGGSDQALADRVVGPGAELPSASLTWGVAALLAAAALAVWRTARSTDAIPRMVTWGAAAVLGLRGVIGMVTDLTAGFDDVYEHLDLAVYSPFCLVLAGGAAITAQRSFVGSRPGPRRQSPQVPECRGQEISTRQSRHGAAAV